MPSIYDTIWNFCVFLVTISLAFFLVDGQPPETEDAALNEEAAEPASVPPSSISEKKEKCDCFDWKPVCGKVALTFSSLCHAKGWKCMHPDLNSSNFSNLVQETLL